MSAIKVSGLGLETVEVFHDYKKGKDIIGIRGPLLTEEEKVLAIANAAVVLIRALTDLGEEERLLEMVGGIQCKRA